jgi:predicted dehydrogenase
MNIGIIGYGYWGPNLLRNFSLVNDCQVKMVSDFRKERLDLVSRSYPSVHVTMNSDEVITSSKIDAVVIATPVSTHYALAKKALEQGKHVLIEKPITPNSAEAEELINLAQKNRLTLMVDHTFLYTGAVKRMRKIIEEGILGDIKYFDSSRINLGLFQNDINVLWDLAPHDISILLYLIDKKPTSVNALGVSHTKNSIENIGYLTVNYDCDFLAHFTCSWSSPVKLRTTLIGGDKKMIVFNDLEPSEKIKVYDSGYDYKTDEERKRILIDYRMGDIFIPKIDLKEALLGMAEDFIFSISQKIKPISNPELGLDVVRILEASQQSIKNKGKEIVL